LRAAIARSSLTGVGARFGGSLVGEELVGTLSERLARSLQGLDRPPSASAVERTAVRRRVEAVGELPAPRRIGATDHPAVPAGERFGAPARDLVEKRPWGSEVTREAGARIGESTDTELQSLRAFVDGVIEERGAHIVRAVGLEVPSQHESVRASPLDIALRRYWHTSPRPTTELVSRAPRPVASRDEHYVPQAQNPKDVPRRSRAAIVEPSAPRTVLAAPDGVAPTESRGWWSTRVDAIHSRTESFAPAPVRPSAARFDDDVVDESAFADALAEVLHRQARAYGVVVP
jgi:hypothetical protein